MGGVDIPDWLKGLPLAPEFRPTDTEFADPIAYISKIEKEAGAFGICKVIPPLPKPAKKYTFSNLNRSLSRSPELGNDEDSPAVCSSSQIGSGDKGNDGEVKAVFTTRQQELGHSAKRSKGQVSNRQSAAHKQVWQSGEVYSLEQFESKSKVFARSQLGMIKEVTPLVVEALFWKAASEKPIYLEYANDVPGSGFGEPEFPLGYTHKRWRKRKVNKNRLGAIDFEKRQTNIPRNSNIDKDINAYQKNDSDPSSEKCKQSPSSPTLLSDEGSRFSRQKSSNASSDKEGTAGWKLTNSPWNLQVIARSPGSLTRFMLDDIPGVTSPMIYIGMLFSWFAWHVEDHELHSLNYLHTGSPKTWYAVPGDCAFAFEEVIRSQGYGGNIDRLAALMLLGEKTNLLSPEVVVASGIPCCRLVQNPGEFVVTFPRAYHVGFSHGFNCGEAANFGTPQWLKVAKEAAVRRAAMNYLPMLSHQQLLYMLTMSFISRVPRALLPGARSSRLRDRQKEERELVVKKAFIDDMLNENNLVSVLLRKKSTFYAVIWDPESLPPSACKDSQSLPSSATLDAPCLLVDGSDIAIINSVKKTSSADDVHNETSTVSAIPVENSSLGDPNNADTCNIQIDPPRLYMERVENMYEVDDDLPHGLHVDSGTLTCVACGILGYPFMCIVQPSQRASEEFFPVNGQLQEARGISGLVNRSPSEMDDTVKNSVSDAQVTNNLDQEQNVPSKNNGCISLTGSPNSRTDVRSIDDSLVESFSVSISSLREATDVTETKEPNILHQPITAAPSVKINQSTICIADADTVPNPSLPINPKIMFAKQWNKSNGFLRPRVFCLEHALEIEELMHSKGGANVLIICHSAYPKIKAHASAVAEEIGAPFNCEEVPLDCASQEDLDLINISIDDEEHEECGEDWTSKLGINLQYCVKLRKLFPSKQDQLTLALGGLFSDMVPNSDVSCLKWKSRKSRTPCKAIGLLHTKLSEKAQVKEVIPKEISEESKIIRENKVIQYTRRACNNKKGFLSQATGKPHGRSKKQPPKEASTANEVLDNNTIMSGTQNTENDAVESSKFPTVENSAITTVGCTTEVTREMVEVSDYGNLVSTLTTAKGGNCFVEPTICPTTEDSELCHDSQTTGQKTQNKETSLISEASNPVTLLTIDNVGNDSIDLTDIHTVENSDMVWMSEESSQTAIESSEAQMRNRTMTDTVEGSERVELSDPARTPSLRALAMSTIWSSEVQDGNRNIEDKVEASHTARVSDPTISPGLPAMAVLRTESFETEKGCITMEESYMENNVGTCANLDSSEMQVEIQTTLNEADLCNNANLIGHPDVPLSEVKSSEVLQENQTTKKAGMSADVCPGEAAMLLGSTHSTITDSEPTKKQQRKRKRELEQITEDQMSYHGFIKSPCEGLRPRNSRVAAGGNAVHISITVEVQPKKLRREQPNGSMISKGKKENKKEAHVCDLEGCRMSFMTRAELQTHKRNRCTHEGCGKRFSTHKYAMLHQRVHTEDRPLKCTWEGCTMSFKWAWARTEHLRVHTGERPYQCKIAGCGLTFRFVSDYSRHRRKTGHYVNSPA